MLLFLGLIEIGCRAGRAWQRRHRDENGTLVSSAVGAVLALLAFILAFTIGMARRAS